MVADIIKGLPMPANVRKGAEPKYPWLQMAPGQAFKFTPNVRMSSARAMASNMAAANEVKYAVRQCEDGIYCWRIDGLPEAALNGNYAREAKVIENYEPTPASATSFIGQGKLVGGKEIIGDDDAI